MVISETTSPVADFFSTNAYILLFRSFKPLVNNAEIFIKQRRNSGKISGLYFLRKQNKEIFFKGKKLFVCRFYITDVRPNYIFRFY